MIGVNKAIKIVSAIFGFIVLAGICYGVYWLVIEILELLEKLKPEIIAAIIGAMATVLVGLAAVIISNKQLKQRDIDESHRAKKVEIYKGFLDAVSGLMANENENISKKGFSEQELIDYMVEFKTDILLWGSPQVIKYYLKFEKVSQDGGNVFIVVDCLYKAIREDIGLSNKGLNNHELIKMYLKDPSELDGIL